MAELSTSAQKILDVMSDGKPRTWREILVELWMREFGSTNLEKALPHILGKYSKEELEEVWRVAN